MSHLLSPRTLPRLLMVLLLCTLFRPATAAPLNLQIDKIPADGLVVQAISLGLIRDELQGKPLERIAVSVKSGAESIPAQLVPSQGFGRDNYDATLLIRATGRAQLNGTLEINWNGALQQTIDGPQTVSTATANWTFDASLTGPLPSALTLKGREEALPSTFNDRLIDRKIAAFSLRNDKAARLAVVSEGAIATVVRAQARYLPDDGGKVVAGQPGATYDWYFFRDSPLVFVNARQFSNQAYRWKEMHFLEWNFKNGPFKKLLGDGVVKDLADKGGDGRFQRWAALSGDSAAVAALNTPVLSYDASSSYGSYLHVAAPEPWAGWDGFSRSMTAWLWASPTTQSEIDIAEAHANRATVTGLRLGSQTVSDQLASLRMAAQKLPGSVRSQQQWKISLAERALQAGKMPASALSKLELPKQWHSFTSGKLGLVAEVRPDGMHIVSLYDLERGRELMAARSLPLFALQTRSPNPSEDEVRLFGAHENWDDCRIEKQGNGFKLTFKRGEPTSPLLQVVVTAEADAANSGWLWSIAADNKKAPFAINNVDFPQITMASPGDNAASFYPRAAGVVEAKPLEKAYRAGATYPSGYCTMQFMALYSPAADGSGLYVARHDPRAAIKDITMATDTAIGGLQMSFNQLAENSLTAGNGFKLTGKGVWQLLHGDWYDAAQIYKKFAAREASWWPSLTNEGREDTPLWYRQLDTWACLQMLPDKVTREAEEVHEFLGVPIGVHWYHWNTGFFDNDYPHFYARDGFKESVAALQAKGIHIMPYTNGRLWDTRDRGIEDWEFTTKGLPNAAKEYRDGKLSLDLSSYNATEKDGKKTVLATMCPYTKLWQDTMAELGGDLSKDQGVDGLYYDQISVSVPIPCMDPTHGHPLGGGTWWVDGYHQMLQKIRAARRPGSIVTSEAMAEAYIKYFDGYLSYSSSSDGQVPAFSAIYGGAIQLIGREYEAGAADMNKSLPMKAGQELVYGEQIGWLTHDILFKGINDASREYYKQVVLVRNKIHDYIYAGEMQRPPRLDGPMPKVTADWGPSSTPDWSNKGEVTTDAVLTGAWKKRGADKCVLIFTNVSKAAVDSSFTLDPTQYGIKTKNYSLSQWSSFQSKAQVSAEVGTKKHTISIPARSTLIWEIGVTQ